MQTPTVSEAPLQQVVASLEETSGPDRVQHAATIYPSPADLPIDNVLSSDACPPLVRPILMRIVSYSRMETFPCAGRSLRSQVELYRIAKKHGPIMRVGDLARFSRREFANVPSLGKVKMRALSLLLRRHGVKLRARN